VTYNGKGSGVIVPNLDPEGHPDGTYKMISKEGVFDIVDPENPENSLLLTKTIFDDDLHAGGAFWNKNNPD
jgi:hypothetical protein